MKLIATLEGYTYEVRVEQDGGNMLAYVDGRQYKLEVSEPESDVYLLKHANKIYEIFVSPAKDLDDPLSTTINSRDFDISIADPKRLRGHGQLAKNSRETGEIRASMPGKVVILLKELGDVVQHGDGVIIVEAMKMQNEMKSPIDGIIKKIHCKQGDTVSAGDILIVVG